MPSTPLLGITQVSASQSSKEVTINDAVLALENATNAKLDVDFSASTSILLTATEATRNFIFIATGATADSLLRFPNTVYGGNMTRVFAVRNDSGYQVTVQFNTGAGETVIIPDGETRLIAAIDATDMIVAAEPGTAVTFVSLTDTPSSYTGMTGKFLSANATEDGLEFVDAAVFPAYASNAGKALIVNATEDGVEWATIDAVGAFTDLDDAPASYTGHAGRLVAVNDTEDGLEFIDAPEAEAVQYNPGTKWRIVVIEPGVDPQVGIGEIEFLDTNGIDLATGGTPSASTEDAGKEALYAFDDDTTTAASGWMQDPLFLGDVSIEYDFGSYVTVRSVRLTPIPGFPDFMPSEFAIEYWDGAEWIEAGVRTAAAWVDGVAQTFSVNGFPLTSVVDALVDGHVYVRKDGEWIAPTYPVPCGFTTAPTDSEILLLHVFAEEVLFANDFAGAVASIGTNPTATFTIIVQQNGASIGSIQVSTGGVTTFATTAAEATFAIGDLLTLVAPSSADATIANSTFTLLGYRQ